MTSTFLDVSVSDGLLRVLINRPEKRNALSQAVLDEIAAATRPSSPRP
jgi:enoyl-CoA hydratase/carnithine racemase